MTSPITPPSPTGLLRVLRHAALGTASAILFGAAFGALIGATYWILFGWMLCGAAVALGLTVPAELEDSLGWGVFGAVPGSYLVGSSGHLRTSTHSRRAGKMRRSGDQHADRMDEA